MITFNLVPPENSFEKDFSGMDYHLKPKIKTAIGKTFKFKNSTHQLIKGEDYLKCNDMEIFLQT